MIIRYFDYACLRHTTLRRFIMLRRLLRWLMLARRERHAAHAASA